MFIKKVIWQHRRDMKVLYECEHCGNCYEDSAYDDANFHNNVVPCIRCSKCGKTANKDNTLIHKTKYPEDLIV